MSHHIAVYVDREKTLILSVFSKFSSHLKDNSWLLFYFQMQSICFSTLLNSEPSNYTVLILYSQKKTNVSFWAFLIYSFVFLNLLPTALNNCEGTTGKCSFDALMPKSDTSTYGSCKCHTDHYKELKKKVQTPPRIQTIHIKWNKTKLRLYVCGFLSPFLKAFNLQ